MLEQKVYNLLHLLEHMEWFRYGRDDVNRAFRLLSFIEEGRNKGISSFFTYKKSLEIVEAIKKDKLLALVSPSEFIRELARLIYQENL